VLGVLHQESYNFVYGALRGFGDCCLGASAAFYWFSKELAREWKAVGQDHWAVREFALLNGWMPLPVA